jgi:predicted permease
LLLAFATAVKALKASPMLSILAIGTLTVGIGATTTMFSIADVFLFRPINFGAHTGRVASINAIETRKPLDLEEQGLSWPELREARTVSSFDQVEGFVFRNFNIDAAVDGGGYRVRGGSLTPGLFGVLDERPVLGRDFTESDAADFGFETSVILSHELWQTRFGGDLQIVGKPVGLNGRQLTVIGVMRPGFSFPFRQQIWLPWAPNPARLPTERFIMALGLLRAGVNADAATVELRGVTLGLRSTYPEAMKDFEIRAYDFKALAIPNLSQAWASLLLFGAALLLIVACTNLASALLARSLDRRKEFAVRSAMGASRGHLIADVVAEAGLIALAGGLFGYGLSRTALPLLIGSFSEPLPYWAVLTTDLRAFAVSLALGALTAITLGLLTARRASAVDLTRDLKDGGRAGSPSRESRRTQSVLVASQVAVSVTLFAMASLLVKSGANLLTADTGVREEGLLTFRAYISGDAYDSPTARAAAVDRLIAGLKSQPGVESVAVSSAIPADDSGDDVRVSLGQETQAEEMVPSTMVRATPGLFRAFGSGLLAGAAFQEGDLGLATSRETSAVIGLRLADRLFGDAQKAVGKSLTILAEDSAASRYTVRIVGVAPNVQWEEVGETTDYSANAVYVPQGDQIGRTISVLARARSGALAAALVPLTPKLVTAAIPGASAFDVRTMKELRAFTTWEQRLFGRLMSGFGAGALIAAATGLYGLLGYFVATRRREIGVRLALGASPGEVARLVVSRAAFLAGTGAAVGVTAALLLARAASGLLFGVSAFDTSGPLAGAIALVILVVAASVVPALRASRVDPVDALRAE